MTHHAEVKIPPITADPQEAGDILEEALKKKRGIGFAGGSGIGKTSIFNQAAKRHTDATGETVKIIWRNPASEDSIDNRGALSMATAEPEFVPIGEMREIFIDDSDPVADLILVILEDFGGAPDAIKKAYMPLLLDNRDGSRFVNGKEVRPEVVVCWTSNRKKDKGGVSGMLDNVIGRTPVVLQVESDLDSWIENFAIPHGFPMNYISWLKWNPQFFNEEKPKTDFTKRGNPRNHEAAVEVFTGWALNDRLMEISIAGAIGDAASLDLFSFLKIYDILPDFDLIVADPTNATVPEQDTSAMWAVAGMLAENADLDNWAAVVKYTDRFTDREFAVFAVASAVRLHEELTSTQVYTDWARANTHLYREEDMA